MAQTSLPINLAIFASGRGSNAYNILKYCQESKILTPKIIFSDNKNANVLKIASNFDTPTLVIEKEPNQSKQDYETKILNALDNYNIHWVLLAGFMKILGPTFLNQFSNKVINIHPSLLPDLPGLNAYQRAFDQNYSESGATIHYVDQGVDTGEIIIQDKFKRLKEDTLESFSQRGLNIEYKLYRQFLTMLENQSAI